MQPSLVATAGVCALALPVSQVLHGWPGLVATVLAGMAGALAALALLSRPIFREVADLLRAESKNRAGRWAG